MKIGQKLRETPEIVSIWFMNNPHRVNDVQEWDPLKIGWLKKDRKGQVFMPQNLTLDRFFEIKCNNQHHKLIFHGNMGLDVKNG